MLSYKLEIANMYLFEFCNIEVVSIASLYITMLLM